MTSKDEQKAWRKVHTDNARKINTCGGVPTIPVIVHFIANALKDVPDKYTLCDVGGATGILAIEVKNLLEEKHGKTHGKIYIVEPLETEGFNRDVVMVESTAETFSKKIPEQVDAIICSTVLSYTNKKKTLNQIKRALKPGGVAVFICHVKNKNSGPYFTSKKWEEIYRKSRPLLKLAMGLVKNPNPHNMQRFEEKKAELKELGAESLVKMATEDTKLKGMDLLDDDLKKEVDDAGLNRLTKWIVEETEKSIILDRLQDAIEYISAGRIVNKSAMSAIEKGFVNEAALEIFLKSFGFEIVKTAGFNTADVRKDWDGIEVGEEKPDHGFDMRIGEDVIDVWNGPDDFVHFIGAVAKPVQ